MTTWTFDELNLLGTYIDKGLSAGQSVKHFPGRTRSALSIAANRQGWHFGQPRTHTTVRMPAPRVVRTYSHITFSIASEAKQRLYDHASATGVTMTQVLNSLILDHLRGDAHEMDTRSDRNAT